MSCIFPIFVLFVDPMIRVLSLVVVALRKAEMAISGHRFQPLPTSEVACKDCLSLQSPLAIEALSVP